ncbi:hypothetical protein LguiA_012214 [Lonicera macranthoides]
MRNHSPHSLTIFLITSFLILSIFIHNTEAEVITLTADTFTDKVKEKDTAWFVRFCVPWCKHCKKLGSLWEDLGKVMEGEDEIEIGQVDCGTDKPVCSKVDIHSYPTFKLFYNGEEVAKYQVFYEVGKHGCGNHAALLRSIGSILDTVGPRDVDSLKMFVLEETEKAAAKALLASRI